MGKKNEDFTLKQMKKQKGQKNIEKSESEGQAERHAVLPSAYSKASVLHDGGRTALRDNTSEAHSFLPIIACGEDIYYFACDKDVISNIDHQKSCDYIISCIMKSKQTSFIELKGREIRANSGGKHGKQSYNPYVQIEQTLSFLKNSEEYFCLLTGDMHAFIVSPCSQKIPKHIHQSERQLWKSLISKSVFTGKEKGKNRETLQRVHYVRVVPSGRYSDNGKYIICTGKEPVPFPYG